MTIDAFKMLLERYQAGTFAVYGGGGTERCLGQVRHKTETMPCPYHRDKIVDVKLCPMQMLPPIRRSSPRDIAERIGMDMDDFATITHTSDGYHFVQDYFDPDLRAWMEEVLVG